MLRAGIALLVSILILPVFASTPGQTAPVPDEAPVAVAMAAVDENGVAAARLQHMLDLNSAFGATLVESDIVESAETALLDFAETDENGLLVIDRTLVENFIENFYGRKKDLGEADKIPLPAKGYTKYSHSVVSVEDCGSNIAVVSAMTFTSHDGVSADALVKSVFVRAANSSFGYHLVSSEIL